jgi:hypothetical protein
MKKPITQGTDPIAGCPRMPAEYGIPKRKTGLLPWSHVTERMSSANPVSKISLAT